MNLEVIQKEENFISETYLVNKNNIQWGKSRGHEKLSPVAIELSLTGGFLIFYRIK